MYKTNYLRNNIQYRIVSSKALSDYKNAQAFMLTELVCGSHRFSDTARDIALLYYDNWFKFCTSAEHCVLRQFKYDDPDSSLANTLKSNVRNTVIELNTVMKRYTEVFIPDFLNLFKIVTKDLVDVLEIRINKSTCAKTNKECYSQVVNNTIEYLNSVMYVLHELDTVVGLVDGTMNDKLIADDLGVTDEDPYCSALVPNERRLIKPFVCVSYSSLYYYTTTGKFLELERMAVYVHHYPTLSLDKMYVKCYVPISLLGQDVDASTPSGAMILKLAEALQSTYNVKEICFE